jgi:3-phenylpropionate/trans-cinnamate dioxygenase ferredoxin reductase subunit
MTSARRLVIVGGGPGGLAAARGYREAGGDGAVTILTDEVHAPYTRPALSKELLRGETEPEDIAEEEPGFYAEQEIELRHEAVVEALDPAARSVTLAGGETVSFDACVLAMGGEPARLPVPGAEHALLLRSLDSALELRERAASAYSAVVIGSGFIGCEAAVSLAMRGLRVTLVSDEAVPHAARLGKEAGGRIATWLAEQGVALALGVAVESIAPGVVRRPGAAPLEADLVLMAAGIRPRIALAEAAGLEVGDGRVLADEHQRTSAEGVYAVGDIALARNAAAGRRLPVEHWGEALNQGEVAGRCAAGEDAAWATAPGFWSVIGERTLKHVAWGDGFDSARLIDHPGGAFTVWYGREGVTVGVLAYESDEDYERGRELVEGGEPLP